MVLGPFLTLNGSSPGPGPAAGGGGAGGDASNWSSIGGTTGGGDIGDGDDFIALAGLTGVRCAADTFFILGLIRIVLGALALISSSLCGLISDGGSIMLELGSPSSAIGPVCFILRFFFTLVLPTIELIVSKAASNVLTRGS